MTPALILAGGRIGGEYAEAAGTTVKAMAPIAGKPAIGYVLDTLRAMPEIGPICVVGATEVRESLDPADLWEAETGSAPGNLEAGIRRLGNPETVVASASDLPMVTIDAIRDFFSRAPADADICLPLVAKERYVAAYPDGRDQFVRLREGQFTAGSVIVLRPSPVLENRALIEKLFNARKSQFGMARVIGFGIVAQFLAGRLTVAAVEKRLTELSGCRCRAVLGCRPELAFNTDSLADLRYAERCLEGQGST